MSSLVTRAHHLPITAVLCYCFFNLLPFSALTKDKNLIFFSNILDPFWVFHFILPFVCLYVGLYRTTVCKLYLNVNLSVLHSAAFVCSSAAVYRIVHAVPWRTSLTNIGVPTRSHQFQWENHILMLQYSRSHSMRNTHYHNWNHHYLRRVHHRSSRSHSDQTRSRNSEIDNRHICEKQGQSVRVRNECTYTRSQNNFPIN